MTQLEMLMDRWTGPGRMSNKKTFKPGDKFILELGEERKMFDEYEIAGTDLYVKKDLLEKLTPYELNEQPEIICCRDCICGHGEVWLSANGNADFYGYCGKSGMRVLPYDFCSKAERREDG